MLLLRIAVKVAVVVGLFVAFIAVLVVLGMWASHMPAGSLP